MYLYKNKNDLKGDKFMTGEFVKKTWGHEIWFANVDEENVGYCGKKIFVVHGKWSSKGAYHYHKIKDETFYILDGYLHLDYVTSDGEHTFKILGPGESFRIKPNIKHRFTSETEYGCLFIEVSTTHSDDDSYRCTWHENVWLEVLNE